jgi:hypothetical protein
MTKASEPLRRRPNTITGRFHVMVDKDADPADWDRAVARFLLAGPAGGSSASATAERASMGISAREQAEHLDPVFVAGVLRRPRDVVLMEESAALSIAGSACWPRPCFATEKRIHG